MSEFRTTRQIAADQLDLEVFRVITALLRFDDDHKDKNVRAMAADICGMRHHVRKHMHPKDREAAA
jgi:uncharacterized glyoxalase superfamily metalloenzyme YdcJ